jgi:hypothetical protein
MKRILLLSLVCCAIGNGVSVADPSAPLAGVSQTSAAAPLTAAAAVSPSIVGLWTGKLPIGAGMTLRVAFKITVDAHGALSSTLDSLDQGAMNIPIASTTFEDNQLDLKVTAVDGEFKGALSKDGATLTGTWTQNGMTLPLILVRSEKEEIPTHSQEPAPPFPYVVNDVSYPNAKAGITLAGTLTKPFGLGPFPAVVLITGSGPQDRDELILGHKPFLVLADYLTRRGMAVLRVDDRGAGKSTGNFATASTMDFADDTLAGVDYLKRQPNIDHKHIGLIGHSEGGIVAPLVANRSRDVAFIVLMAGPGLRGDQIVERQSVLIQQAMGVPPGAIAAAEKAQKEALDVVREKDPKARAAKLRAVLVKATRSPAGQAELTRVNGGQPMPETRVQSYIEQQMQTLDTPWMRFFLTYDPLPALKKVKCPVLAVAGSRDLQVPPKEDLDAIRAALKAGGNKDFTTKELPELNHLFQPSKTGAPSEYAGIDITLDPSALKVIGDWVERHTR